MKRLTTPSGKSFLYKRCDSGEIIVYSSDKENTHQDRSAIIITPFIENFVRQKVKDQGKILMGASRDAPPRGSLGYYIREMNQSPQQLSYLSAVLQEEGYCTVMKTGKAYTLIHRR
jgi:hypothetical protein